MTETVDTGQFSPRVSAGSLALSSALCHAFHRVPRLPRASEIPPSWPVPVSRPRPLPALTPGFIRTPLPLTRSASGKSGVYPHVGKDVASVGALLTDAIGFGWGGVIQTVVSVVDTTPAVLQGRVSSAVGCRYYRHSSGFSLSPVATLRTEYDCRSALTRRPFGHLILRAAFGAAVSCAELRSGPVPPYWLPVVVPQPCPLPDGKSCLSHSQYPLAYL